MRRKGDSKIRKSFVCKNRKYDNDENWSTVRKVNFVVLAIQSNL